MKLSNLYIASALGIGNEETWENYLRGVAPGMKEIEGDIPGRKIFFGSVLAETHEDTRTNGLLKLAYDNLKPQFDALIAKYGAERVGIVLGASNTGIDEAENYVDEWLKTGEKPAALDFSMIELGTPSLYLQKLTGVKGPVYTVSTACSSSGKSFKSAIRLIENGVIDAAIVGGVDGRCRFAMNGFHALGALSAGKCRPLADDRDGINLGEGVALFTLEGADKSVRFPDGVTLQGVGESSDAYHATAPDPEGNGAYAAMVAAGDLRDVDYINLHGTGTIANDAMEMKAVSRLQESGGLKSTPAIESTKSLTGHCLGAAGAIEAAICYLRIIHGKSVCTLSNSFAFGGSNASVLLHA